MHHLSIAQHVQLIVRYLQERHEAVLRGKTRELEDKTRELEDKTREIEESELY